MHSSLNRSVGNCVVTSLDYTPYLHVTDDGHIWWSRQNAICLGAGFVSVCDDHLQLATRLQAPNQLALVNERTLIGAMSDTRLNLRTPITFERDGFHYVDAAGFLEWLSQYICQTQAKIEFPNELADQVRIALAKAAAERPPVEPKAFESLTLALEGYFNRSLDAIPDQLRQRVETELYPVPWDSLSADQRRTVALQQDYQRDPATETDRKLWWGFFERLHDIQERIREWEVTDTPTATDKSLKESRLEELRLERERMKLQEHQARGDYFPGRKCTEAHETLSPEADDFIAYPKAMKMLAERLNATPEELAAWIFMGPDTGGISAYLNANELTPPPRFHFTPFMGENYVAPLMACWFRHSEIKSFVPEDRYITGETLIKRWGELPGIQAVPFICAKIAESRLLDLHPIFGGTRGTFPEQVDFPPLSAGLFALTHVMKIEVEDGLDSVEGQAAPSSEHPAPITAASQLAVPPSTNADPCAAFRQMVDLQPNEISISIVGDASESGLTGNGMLEINARGTTRRLALAEFDLVDRRTGALNQQAAVLVGLAHGKKFMRNEERHAATMTRLRSAFRERLGVSANPFLPHDKNNGWLPLFSIADLRGRADERAKERAERKTISLDQLQDQGHQFASTETNGIDGDDADKWLQEHDPQHRT